MRVTASDLIKNWSTLADTALREPVTVTSDGMDTLVVISAHEYGRLRERDRQALRAEELSDEEAALIAKAEVPAF